MKLKKMLAGGLLALTVVAGTGTAAFARQGADDPAGHVRHGHGADDGAAHARHGRGAHHGANHR